MVGSLSPIEFDASDGRFRARYDGDRDLTSLAVVAVLARAAGTAAEELSPLQSAVDADALEKLFSGAAGQRGPRSVSLRHEGFDVTVQSDGVIEARRATEA